MHHMSRHINADDGESAEHKHGRTVFGEKHTAAYRQRSENNSNKSPAFIGDSQKGEGYILPVQAKRTEEVGCV